MLAELTIENIAVIDRATIEFSRGFNCLTGETGAGKSMIIDAINCITGEKISRELIRTGETFALVTAVFSHLTDDVCAFLAENDIDVSDGELIVSRRLTRDGKNSCRVNGMPVTVAFLRLLGERLVNIHGQMDSKNLLDPDRHFSYIDLYGNTAETLETYRRDYRRLCDIRAQIKRLSLNEAEKLKTLDMLDFRIEELTDAALRPGELAELTARRELIRNAKKIGDALGLIDLLLSGDEDTEGATGLLSRASDELERVSEYIPELAKAAADTESMSLELEELGGDIRTRLEAVAYTQEDMNAIEERIDLLQRLSRKYGETEEDMLRYLDESVRRRDEIYLAEDRLAELNAQFDAAAEQAKKSAKALSRLRRSAAAEFARAVEKELEFLDMPHVRFTVADTIVPLGENGVDDMRFLFSANPGEEPKPLSKIASGGELSRVMLAIKNVLSGSDRIDTLIFDEIDAGVSGRAAEKIAMKLYEVSLSHQVICVTHLTQLASFADAHYLIEKTARDDRTFTSVRRLDRDGRARELARIGAGAQIGALQLDNARQLMDYARAYKRRFSDEETE